MAEYYPLLAKAVGSLPNSTSETRRIVYERARKALIGQLRTLHPPVPEADIERESVALDRAIERIETELAASSTPASDSIPPAPPGEAEPTTAPPAAAPPTVSKTSARPGGALGSLAVRKPIAPLRPRVPKTAAAADPVSETKPAAGDQPLPETSADAVPKAAVPETVDAPAAVGETAETGTAPKPRLDAQRPIAPQPPMPQGPKRRTWIIPVCVGAVVLLVALAAWKLRVKPESARDNAVATQPQAQPETGKIADRVGGAKPSSDEAQQPSSPTAPAPPTAPTPDEAAAPGQKPQQPAPPPSNPELPVAHRAALLVEAPDTPSKVQTFPGTVVWKLNNVNAGPSDAVGLSVEADIDLPDDKTKAIVTFEKNNDPSLPASHTIKVRFIVDPGSYSGDVKQISVPQMRREGNSDGEPLAGVTVPVIQNSFLVGLSPGNAETANLRLIGELPWIDIPILLNSGKIAKLTFEKGASGQRDVSEALAYWQKQ